MYLNAAGAIENWLLHSRIYIESGAEAGAVAGWLTEAGAPAFAYLEVTGYYLTWLAFASRSSRHAMAMAEQRARKSTNWLGRLASRPGAPPTRQYLLPEFPKDWRNAALFSFDLAMVARGIAHAWNFCPEIPGQALSEQYLGYLLELCPADGKLRPVILREGRQAHELPSTWSTVEGIHHTKTAAAILRMPESLLPARLVGAAHELLHRWADEPWQHVRATPLHPVFYYLEGLMMRAAAGADSSRMDEVATLFTTVMEEQDAYGFLPAALYARSGPLRSDVMAQALRIGCLLRAMGYLKGGGWDTRLDGLARALLSFVGSDGGVSQYPSKSGPAPQRNAWCSMFAHQAFVFYESLVKRRESTPPSYYIDLLI